MSKNLDKTVNKENNLSANGMEQAECLLSRDGQFSFVSDGLPSSGELTVMLSKYTRRSKEALQDFANLIYDAENSDLIFKLSGEIHWGLSLDYLLYKHPEAFKNTSPIVHEHFWNDLRMKRIPIKEGINKFLKYME